MSQYELKNIVPANEAIARNGAYLVILYADRVPPHLSLSVNGQLFSLDVNGTTVGDDIGPLLRLIHKRNVETIFVELNLPPLFDMEMLRRQVATSTSAYPHVKAGLVTCLAPIKDMCAAVYQTEIQDINFVFDLLPRLDAQKVLGQCFHFNMFQHLSSTLSFKLRTYSMLDINERISNARRVPAMH